METMIDGPMYIEPRTYRNYEDYLIECGRARGWNQAMDFIFGERKKNESDRKNEQGGIRKAFRIIPGAVQGTDGAGQGDHQQ